MICAVVTGPAELAEAARLGADLVELRADLLDPADSWRSMLESSPLPVLFTCRPRWAGGAFDGSEAERARLLAEAGRRAAYVDLELGFEQQVALPESCRRLLSHHDFERTPTDLEQLAGRMAATGADLIKLAVRVTSYADVSRLLALPDALGLPTIAIGMGPAGLITRLAYRRYGGAMTYAPVGAAVAPGQVELETMLGYRAVTRSTRLFGLIGSPVAHSASPMLHNAGFERGGIDARYLPFEVTDLQDFLDHWPEGLEGVSVTMPWKEAIVPSLSAVEGEARAVNTVLRRPEGLWGTNTDGPGALQAIREVTDQLAGRHALVLGNGGAAQTVGSSLREAGVKLTVCARHPRPGERDWADRLGVEADWLINTTPVGMAPEPEDTPMPAGQLGRFALVFDLVYNPRRTRLLREAAEAGCQVVGGERMFLHQACRQFALFTGGARAPLALWSELLG